ncbi:hypothetical protein DHD32_06775 [Arenibacter sp. TNZ]|jgi:hypothetical protein|uniref:hypothetical protein n=1 Tax=Arenibacter TaxID=178469 RepID=UPI000CD40354|nr:MULTISPECIES: hypothetical protein [Arenibacter]MCM4171176.1 hypothetical protein [Arenibacter sp. TNZ]
MSKRTTNLLGIVITIIAGTFFNIMMCNSCTTELDHTSTVEASEIIVKNSTAANQKQQIKEP